MMYTYFIINDKKDKVKIGRSTDVERRVKELRTVLLFVKVT